MKQVRLFYFVSLYSSLANRHITIDLGIDVEFLLLVDCTKTTTSRESVCLTGPLTSFGSDHVFIYFY